MMIKRGNTIDVTAKKCAKNECHSKAALSGVATRADWFFAIETTIKLQNPREGIFWESQPSALQGFDDIESLLMVALNYSLVPKESNVTLVPHITLIRPNTLSLKGAITLFWVNTKRKTVMTLFRIVLLSNDCAVITLFKIYLKRVMTDPLTFGCHYSLLDHVKLKLQSWLSFGVRYFTSVQSWLSLGTTHNPSVLPLLSFRTCLSFGTRE